MSLPDPIQSRLLAMLHTRTEALEAGDPVPEPLVLSSAFSLPHNPDARRSYARFTNPTIEATEARLAALEAAPCLLFPSGMGASSAAFMALLKAGDHVLGGDQLYGRSLRLMMQDLPRMGLEASLAAEAVALGFRDVRAVPGGVVCSGDLAEAAR